MLLEPGLIVQASAAYTLPAHFSEYTDCCTGNHHGGQAVHLDNPLLPNYKWVPVGCHDRSSSVVVSGTPVRRPLGQTKGLDDTPPFGLSQRMDCEPGFLMGPGDALAASVLACAAQRCRPRLPCTDLSPPAPLLRKGRRPALVAPPVRSTARPAAATRSRACRAGHPR